MERNSLTPLPGVAGLGMIAVLALTACGPEEGTELESSGHAATDDPGPGGNSEEAGNENDDAGADPSPTESPEPTPVPASSEGPAENWPAPELPEAAYEPDEEGAEAVLEYWTEARVYARNTGDTEPLEVVSDEGCEVCNLELEAIYELYEAGGWYIQEDDELSESWVRPMAEDELENEAYAVFRLTEGGFDVYWQGELDGSVSPGDEYGASAYMLFNGEHWVVGEYDYLAPTEEAETEGRGQE